MIILLCLMKSTSYNASSLAIFSKFLPLPLPYISSCYYKKGNQLLSETISMKQLHFTMLFSVLYHQEMPLQ